MDLLQLFDQMDEEEEEALAIIIADRSARPKCSTRIWVNPVNSGRHLFGEFNNIMPELIDDEERFVMYFRMTKDQFYHLLSLVASKLEKRSTQLRKSISAEMRLAVCLRFLATGNSYRSLGSSFCIGFSTVAAIVKESCQIIWETLQPIYMPEPNEETWKLIAEDFEQKWNYPHCLGTLDGKYVQNQGSNYYNHSIVLLTLVDANCKFTYVDIGAYEWSIDGGMFQRSKMGMKFERKEFAVPRDSALRSMTGSFPYVMLGNDVFPLKTYLMRPYSKNSIKSEEEKVYNYHHLRVRKTVDDAFGILAGRWRVFQKPMEILPETVEFVLLAACCLHNMLRNTTSSITEFEEQIKLRSEEINGFENIPPIRRNYSHEAMLTRENLKRYFVSLQGTTTCL